MARQCLIATIQHELEGDTSAIAENDLQQLETPASLFSGPADKVKCEDLEKVVIGDDPERYFQVGVSGWSSDSLIGEGVVGRSFEKECGCVCMGRL